MFFFGADPAVVLRTAAGLIAAGVVGSDVPASGDLGRVAASPFAPGLRKGDWARGVPVREGGLDGRFIVGLSQEEKKSSSSLAGVLVPSLPVCSIESVITTSSGYLQRQQSVLKAGQKLERGILLSIYSTSPCQLLFVLCSRIACVFRLVILASERSRAAV